MCWRKSKTAKGYWMAIFLVEKILGCAIRYSAPHLIEDTTTTKQKLYREVNTQVATM